MSRVMCFLSYFFTGLCTSIFAINSLPDLKDAEVPKPKKGERKYIIFRPVDGGEKEP
ncbi:hypothetical protein [Candidatus Enterococcus ferrettii]|uniref:hypothetical protein n=1 Tax=Candidatus Enterococcus ferrettii TaxID=2815324 RepID=UPI001F621117|nr:hypothetical protein [Enterococcus sp. 665A]